MFNFRIISKKLLKMPAKLLFVSAVNLLEPSISFMVSCACQTAWRRGFYGKMASPKTRYLTFSSSPFRVFPSSVMWNLRLAPRNFLSRRNNLQCSLTIHLSAPSIFFLPYFKTRVRMPQKSLKALLASTLTR